MISTVNRSTQTSSNYLEEEDAKFRYPSRPAELQIKMVDTSTQLGKQWRRKPTPATLPTSSSTSRNYEPPRKRVRPMVTRSMTNILDRDIPDSILINMPYAKIYWSTSERLWKQLCKLHFNVKVKICPQVTWKYMYYRLITYPTSTPTTFENINCIHITLARIIYNTGKWIVHHAINIIPLLNVQTNIDKFPTYVTILLHSRWDVSDRVLDMFRLNRGMLVRFHSEHLIRDLMIPRLDEICTAYGQQLPLLATRQEQVKFILRHPMRRPLRCLLESIWWNILPYHHQIDCTTRQYVEVLANRKHFEQTFPYLFPYPQIGIMPIPSYMQPVVLFRPLLYHQITRVGLLRRLGIRDTSTHLTKLQLYKMATNLRITRNQAIEYTMNFIAQDPQFRTFEGLHEEQQTIFDINNSYVYNLCPNQMYTSCIYIYLRWKMETQDMLGDLLATDEIEDDSDDDINVVIV